MLSFESLQYCRYTVIGDPIGHTRSPALQNAAFEALDMGRPYGMLHVRPDELPQFADWAARHLDGFNLTLPHKTAILPMLATVEPAAAAARSVNTVCCRDGRLHGFSTDGWGLEMALRESFDLPLAGARILFLGCGGAVRATAFHLAASGAAAIRLLNRTVSKAGELAADLRRFAPGLTGDCVAADDLPLAAAFWRDSTVIIQATSAELQGMAAPAMELLPECPAIPCFDMVYPHSEFVRQAQNHGHPAATGASMLLYQGAKSFEIWTGSPAPVETMRIALQASLTC